MTTTIAPVRGTSAPRRIARVVRLLYVNPRTLILTPWMVLGIIFVATFLIWLIIASQNGGTIGEDAQSTGSLGYFFVYMLVSGVLSMSAGFPFALGLSVTRRDYYLGTGVAFLLSSLGSAIALTILAGIERATHGWGLRGYMFGPAFLGDNLLGVGVVYLIALVFFSFVGTFAATVYMRWRITGMLVAGSALLVLVIGAIALATFTHSWPGVAAWFVAHGALGAALWALVPTACFALAGFFVLRGATPKG